MVNRRVIGWVTWMTLLMVTCLLAGVSLSARAQTPVDVPSLDAAAGAPLQQSSFWFPARGVTGPAPAMVLLHGCGGPFVGKGPDKRLALRMREYASLLNGWGIHVLVTDSFTPRGETELCTQREATRRIGQTERRRDALGALVWLAAQPGVDAQRLGFMGWSHGGSTVLAATNLRHPETVAAPVKPSLSVLFYPGCFADLQAGYQASAPLLMMVGELDDWTSPVSCEKLARTQPEGLVTLHSYPGAYHGFDGTEKVRHRMDVPNGSRPGQGVHVGGHPPAREASRQQLEAYLRERWGLQPAKAAP